MEIMFDEIYKQYKLNNKLSCFKIFYKTKNSEILFYTVSFINNFCEKKVLNDLKNINNSNNFECWISPLEIKNYNIRYV